MIQGKKGNIQNLKTVNDDSYDFKVKINMNIGGKLIEEDIEEALTIPTIDKLNPTILANMMAESPSLHARWNFLYNEAVYEHDMEKTKVELWISKKSQQYRKDLAKTEKGRITDKMVDESVKLDPEYQGIMEGLALAKKNMKHILALANGFGEKGEKVISIASMIKWEGENISGNRRVNKIKQEKGQQGDLSVNDGWPTA